MAQQLKKYAAPSLDAAYKQMRHDLGDSAVVINAIERRDSGLRGMLGRKIIELTASVNAPEHAPVVRKPSPAERKYLSHQHGKNAAAPAPSTVPIGSDEAVNETVAYFKQLVADAQKRMAAPATEPGSAPAHETLVPFARHEDKTGPGVQQELSKIREMIQVLMAERPNAAVPENFVQHYRRLVDLGVTRRHAAKLVINTVHGVDARSLRDDRVFKERLKLQIRREIQITGGIALHAGKCRVVALVGATGVGKTTNLAKLAAHFAIRERARVAFITTDTYRVAAPDQLRVYANIIGLDVHVVNDADEYARALRALRRHDLVLVDTAGGSPYNTEQIEELRATIAVAPPDEVILVVAANAQFEEQATVLQNFAKLAPTSILISKIDETRRYGALFSIAADAKLPLSYFSTGQSVPDDLALAHAGMVANWIVEGEDRRGRSSA